MIFPLEKSREGTRRKEVATRMECCVNSKHADIALSLREGTVPRGQQKSLQTPHQPCHDLPTDGPGPKQHWPKPALAAGGRGRDTRDDDALIEDLGQCRVRNERWRVEEMNSFDLRLGKIIAEILGGCRWVQIASRKMTRNLLPLLTVAILHSNSRWRCDLHVP